MHQMSKLTGGKTNHQKQNQAIDTSVYLNQRQKFRKRSHNCAGVDSREKVRQNELNDKKNKTALTTPNYKQTRTQQQWGNIQNTFVMIHVQTVINSFYIHLDALN